ncbi:MFS transporter [Lentzea flava]|uniref:MFS transporter n=1 Tax=Lentzea flava TaxID=103732 RepID=A0ABQ2UGK2_9PSEU|nr:MFS transporter [Lentzea flava]MCP2198991.1 drug resistance transporter, EmrB/QacA subfamily [Lentzea flava]GGU32421.1 MFS transporter [Lentzea flava]
MTEATTTNSAVLAHRWKILGVVCLVQFMLMVDDTVVNVALPSIQSDLGFTPATLPWIVNAYILAFGGLLVAAGRIGDRIGLVRTFVAGTALFAVASLACGVAQEPWQLVAARFVQGIGSALTSPTVLGLITVVFRDPAERGRAFGIWGGVAVTGGLSGVVLGGLITGLLEWRWVFYINLPVAAVALVLLPLLTKGVATAGRDVRIGLTGAVLLTGAVAATVYGLLGLAEAHSLARTAGFLGLAAVLFALFVVSEKKSTTPLVPAGLLSSRVRVAALVAGVLATGALFGVFFTLTLQLQRTLGFGPVLAGLAYVPFALGSFTSIKTAAKLAQRIAPQRLLLLATLVVALGGLLLAGGVLLGGYWALLPGLVVFGFGISTVLPVTAQLAVAGVAPENAGVAGGLVTSAQQLGGAVGLAVAGVLLGAAGDRHATALVGAVVLAGIAAVASLRTRE